MFPVFVFHFRVAFTVPNHIDLAEPGHMLE